MKITMLTRKFPPVAGGMETFSYQLTTHFAPKPHLVAIPAHKQRDIVWIAPVLLWRGLRLRKDTDVYHLHDLVLAPLARVLKWLTKKPVVVTVHALELTYSSGLLRRLIDFGIPAIDHFVAVSDYTAGLLAERGIAPDRVSVITHGVLTPTVVEKKQGREELENAFNIPQDRVLILMVGRLVKRKGAVWFCNNILRRIVEEWDTAPHFAITSTGPELERLQAWLAANPELAEHISVLGKVSDETLNLLYSAADIFVAPNRPTPSDAEGFGFVSVEAASYGLPIVASNVEGIPSAVHSGKNGILLEPDNRDGWVQQLTVWAEAPSDREAFGKQAKEYTLEHFNWNEKANQYYLLFESILK